MDNGSVGRSHEAAEVKVLFLSVGTQVAAPMQPRGQGCRWAPGHGEEDARQAARASERVDPARDRVVREVAAATAGSAVAMSRLNPREELASFAICFNRF